MRLKKGVENFLVFMQIINIIFLGSDCDNLLLFIITKLIALFMIVMIHLIITRFTNFYEGD